MKTNDARKLKPDAQEVLRKRTVAAVRKGMSISEASRAFGVSRQAIYQWQARVEKGGTRGLNSRKRGRRGGGQLAPWQLGQIARSITDRCPDQLKLPFALWTREAVQQLIAARFDIHVSVWTVGRYLRKMGFTPQKPLRRAYEQNPKVVAQWLKVKYPRIRRQAWAEGAEIHWGDEMGLRSDHQTGRTYGRRGETPLVEGTGQRFRCNIISTVTNRGTLRFMVFRKDFTTPIFLEFLKRLVRDLRREVFLIVDRHPVHQAAGVKRWLKRNSDNIRMFFLPTCLPAHSPELNPDELLNNDVKTNAVGRERARNLPEMESNTRRYLRSTHRQPDIVRSYFHKESVRYAAI